MLKKILLISLLFSFFSLEARQKEVFDKEQAENLRYNKTIRAFMKDNKTITSLVNESYAYVVFPSVGKGGAILGGAYGEGRVFRRGMWVGDTTMTQYTIGLQVGGQAYSEIIFLMTRDAFKRFKQGGFTGSTQSSLVPIYSGISGDVNIAKDVLVYTSSTGGLMLEATTGAQKFTYKTRE